MCSTHTFNSAKIVIFRENANFFCKKLIYNTVISVFCTGKPPLYKPFVFKVFVFLSKSFSCFRCFI